MPLWSVFFPQMPTLYLSVELSCFLKLKRAQLCHQSSQSDLSSENVVFLKFSTHVFVVSICTTFRYMFWVLHGLLLCFHSHGNSSEEMSFCHLDFCLSFPLLHHYTLNLCLADSFSRWIHLTKVLALCSILWKEGIFRALCGSEE